MTHTARVMTVQHSKVLNVATTHRRSYSNIATPLKPRFGPCDQEGFRQVRRGSKPQPQVVPRVAHHQPRYAFLQDVQDTEVEADKIVSEPLAAHVSYGVQTRTMANLKSPVDLLPSGSMLSPGEDLLVHRRGGHAHSHPGCTNCLMGKLQARRTPFRRSTDKAKAQT